MVYTYEFQTPAPTLAALRGSPWACDGDGQGLFVVSGADNRGASIEVIEVNQGVPSRVASTLHTGPTFRVAWANPTTIIGSRALGINGTFSARAASISGSALSFGPELTDPLTFSSIGMMKPFMFNGVAHFPGWVANPDRLRIVRCSLSGTTLTPINEVTYTPPDFSFGEVGFANDGTNGWWFYRRASDGAIECFSLALSTLTARPSFVVAAPEEDASVFNQFTSALPARPGAALLPVQQGPITGLRHVGLTAPIATTSLLADYSGSNVFGGPMQDGTIGLIIAPGLDSFNFIHLTSSAESVLHRQFVFQDVPNYESFLQAADVSGYQVLTAYEGLNDASFFGGRVVPGAALPPLVGRARSQRTRWS